MADTLIVIPARMASTRLPGKPLADIAGEPMIVHVMRRAQAARLPAVDIATLAAEITRPQERSDPNVVKLVGTPVAERRLRALYFTRATAPAGEGPLYHHIGLYAFRRAALGRFVALAPSPLERREKLEQLRALEAGMRIDATIVESVPLGVDTPEDLERAREILARTPIGSNRDAL
jgi:3-deoxy-manno-octulosonate cytidylyltransferase (CMP-KDO synthetase)